MSTDLVYDVLRAGTNLTMCCCGRRAPTRRPAFSTSSASANASRASGAESSTRRWSASRRSGVSVMLEIGREAVYGDTADDMLAEAEGLMMREAAGDEWSAA